ncbi:MAG: hypothetical protein ABSA18_12940 [Dehalococcoidia bacterium]
MVFDLSNVMRERTLEDFVNEYLEDRKEKGDLERRANVLIFIGRNSPVLVYRLN